MSEIFLGLGGDGERQALPFGDPDRHGQTSRAIKAEKTLGRFPGNLTGGLMR